MRPTATPAAARAPSTSRRDSHRVISATGGEGCGQGQHRRRTGWSRRGRPGRRRAVPRRRAPEQQCRAQLPPRCCALLDAGGCGPRPRPPPPRPRSSRRRHRRAAVRLTEHLPDEPGGAGEDPDDQRHHGADGVGMDEGAERPSSRPAGVRTPGPAGSGPPGRPRPRTSARPSAGPRRREANGSGCRCRSCARGGRRAPRPWRGRRARGGRRRRSERRVESPVRLAATSQMTPTPTNPAPRVSSSRASGNRWSAR